MKKLQLIKIDFINQKNAHPEMYVVAVAVAY